MGANPMSIFLFFCCSVCVQEPSVLGHAAVSRVAPSRRAGGGASSSVCLQELNVLGARVDEQRCPDELPSVDVGVQPGHVAEEVRRVDIDGGGEAG